jgi:hypothetical protein
MQKVWDTHQEAKQMISGSSEGTFPKHRKATTFEVADMMEM